MYYCDEMQKEAHTLTVRIHQLEQELNGLPDGSLTYSQYHGYYKYYQRLPACPEKPFVTSHYIPKADRQLALDLAKKSYLQRELLDARQELSAIQAYFKRHKEPSAEELLRNSAPFHALLQDQMISVAEKCRKWQNAPFTANPYHPEELTVPTLRGEKVRSKSEAAIADELYRNGIAYRYEAPLELACETRYPDFTLIHPKTYRIMYWEHFGLMDSNAYIRKNTIRIGDYANAGIAPGVDLIMSFETARCPFTAQAAHQLVQV